MLPFSSESAIDWRGCKASISGKGARVVLPGKWHTAQFFLNRAAPSGVWAAAAATKRKLARKRDASNHQDRWYCAVTCLSNGPDSRPARPGKRVSRPARGGPCFADDSARRILLAAGPSGCGKTTTLRMIAGFEQPTSGEVRLSGEVVNGRRPYERNVSTVFQSYALFPHLTAQQNVEFGLRRQGADGIAKKVAAGARTGAPDGQGEARVRPSFRAANGSGWRWRDRWWWSPTCCCWTSLWRRSIPSCESRCASN